MKEFKLITSIVLILLILFLSWLLFLGFAFNWGKKDFYIKFIICLIIFIIFLILTFFFIIKINYTIPFVISYFIITLIISYSILSNDLIIKYIPLLLSTIYMLLNIKKFK